MSRSDKLVDARLQAAGLKSLLEVFCFLPIVYVDPATVLDVATLAPSDALTSQAIIGRLNFAAPVAASQSKTEWYEVHLIGLKDSPRSPARVRLQVDLTRGKELGASIRIGDACIVVGTLKWNEGWLARDPHIITLGPLGVRLKWPLKPHQTILYPTLSGCRPHIVRCIIQQTALRFATLLDHHFPAERFAERGLITPAQAVIQLHVNWPTAELMAFNSHTSLAHQSLKWFTELSANQLTN